MLQGVDVGEKATNRALSELGVPLANRGDPAASIRQALARDELALYCQPVAALGGGAAFPMAEVLVRLHEEEKELLPPGEFLPIFERHGLMPELDRWVVRHVVRHIAGGSRIARFSINVSSQSLADDSFAKAVAVELVSAGVSGTSILFEIDEAVGLARTDEAQKFARDVGTVGCRLILDGFGRRSVSLAALKGLRLEFVKVDGSIVRKLLTDAKAARRLRAIQKVGDAMGFKLIAEMVEDRDILLQLKALDVAFAQGFGIREPHAIELLARPGSRKSP